MENILNYIFIALLAYFIYQRFIPTKGVRQITTVQLKDELKDQNKQFIDVRTPGEFNVYHLNEFTNIPLQQLSKKTSDLSKEKEVIVICQSGMRSNKATKMLKKQGFNKVTNVKGGMSAWS
jgi:rhodanese-related sulfurtransferase